MATRLPRHAGPRLARPEGRLTTYGTRHEAPDGVNYLPDREAIDCAIALLHQSGRRYPLNPFPARTRPHLVGLEVFASPPGPRRGPPLPGSDTMDPGIWETPLHAPPGARKTDAVSDPTSGPLPEGSKAKLEGQPALRKGKSYALKQGVTYVGRMGPFPVTWTSPSRSNPCERRSPPNRFALVWLDASGLGIADTRGVTFLNGARLPRASVSRSRPTTPSSSARPCSG